MSKPAQLLRLIVLMDACGLAMFDDREFNAPVFDDDFNIVGGNGTNAYEAAYALDAVAQILGIDGPSVVYDRLCEEADNA